MACAHTDSPRAPSVDPLARDLAALARDAREPEAQVVSDNTISNERTYLDVAAPLARHAPPDRAYVGVGPEQNFAYIALVRPAVAFIVDYRRDNFVLHVAYRALFELAPTRAAFVCMLLGRPCAGARVDGDADAVLAAATARAPSSDERARTRDAIVARARTYDLALDGADLGRLVAQLDVLFERQLDGRPPSRANEPLEPSLRELFVARANGVELGFLASEDAYRVVQSLERRGRVVPIVGDFAGDVAMGAIAGWMRAHAMPLGVFYASNVEQDLSPTGWTRWMTNARALPHDARSLAIRAVVAAREGERSATFLHSYAALVARDAPAIDVPAISE